MKRAPELASLSRDHHQGLYAAMQLKRASEVEPVREHALAFWDELGSAHFVLEETRLLPGWLSRANGADRELAARVLREHLSLRVRFLDLGRGRLDAEAMNQLGRALEDHIRFEERELFPAIEASLESKALAELGKEVGGEP